MRKQKIIKRIIFALFLLQKIKFEEIRKYCLYIIIYKLLYIIIYEQFIIIIIFNLTFCKRNKTKIILLIIFCISIIILLFLLYQIVILQNKKYI